MRRSTAICRRGRAATAAARRRRSRPRKPWIPPSCRRCCAGSTSCCPADPQPTSTAMLLSTTSTLEGHPIRNYLGLVSGEAILGANVFRDFFAGIRDIIGGRSGSYEKVLRKAKEAAIEDMVEAAKDL